MEYENIGCFTLYVCAQLSAYTQPVSNTAAGALHGLLVYIYTLDTKALHTNTPTSTHDALQVNYYQV